MKNNFKTFCASQLLGKQLGTIGIVLLLFMISCGPKKPKDEPPASMQIEIKMPATTSNGNYAFPSFYMDRIEVSVTGIRGYNWPTSGTPKYSYYNSDCYLPNIWCPRNSSFFINVPNEGSFIINFVAMTGTCTQANINTGCKSKTGMPVGALQKYTWRKEVLAGTVFENGSVQLNGDPYVNATGNLTVENKCCCHTINDNQMCGVQPDQTKYNTCASYNFVENTYSYTGVCGADPSDQYFCSNADHAISELDRNCGVECSIQYPCTESGYSCSTGDGVKICQKPCATTSNCPSGQGCNTGWCR